MKEEKIVSPGRPRINLDKATIAEMRRLHDKGISYRKLAMMFGISRWKVADVLKSLK